MDVASRACTQCQAPIPVEAGFCTQCGAPTPTRVQEVPGGSDEPRLRAALADRYRIERRLGAGGMGTVYLARDVRHGRDVALKVLRPDVAHAMGRARFLREIHLAARLNHPNILSLYDSGECDGFLYFVMPVMEGQTLRERLREERTLPVDEAVRIAVEVADALDYAHRQDVVHRDIKPENILLHEGHAVVADFGIGKVLEAAPDRGAAVTQVGMSVGTPAYMSPEQAAGEDVDGRSDLFALGCVLYEMLTGEPAFGGPTVSAVIASRFAGSPPDVRERRPAVPPQVGAVVARLLAKARAERQASGAQVVEALRSLEMPATAPPPGDEKSLVVLPFASVGADPENEVFADGLTEELIADLAQVRSLRVISRTSSMHFKGTRQAMRDVGRELGVRYALEGGVRKAGKSLRITAQLVDTQTDARLWGDKYAGTVDDVFALQDRVSRAIVAALDVTLSREEGLRLTRHPIRDARAFELYIRARRELQHYQADRAMALIEEALGIEGPMPALRALAAAVRFVRARVGAECAPGSLDEAEAEARSLVEMVPDAAWGYALLGLIAFERGTLPAAVQNLRAAIERDPTDADVHFFLGIALLCAGQVEEAAAASRRFVAADPLAPHAPHLAGIVTWYDGRAAEGLEAMERSIELDPENPMQRWAAGYHHALLGHVEEARGHAEFLLRCAPLLPYTAQLRALVAALQGRAEDALAALAPVDTSLLDGHARFHLGEAFAMAGDAGCALALVDDAVHLNFHPRDFIARHDPFMAPLRSLPGFARVVETAKRREEEFAA